MVFCSNCGHELTGAKKFCTKCGYKIEESDLRSLDEQSSNRTQNGVRFEGVDKENDRYGDLDSKSNYEMPKKSEDEIYDKPSENKKYRLRAPPDAIVKEKIPKSTHCQICNTKTDDICFFCNYAICNKHSITMQMYADNAKFGNVINSCSDCSGRKNGRQPTTDEAAEIGFFFKIKPYHEWKIIN